MDGIDALSGKLDYFKKRKKKIKNKKDKKITFVSILNSEIETTENVSGVSEIYDIEDIESVLDKVFETGEKLKQNQSLENIKNYKKIVKQFLEYIIKNTFKVEEKTSGVNILKRKKFTLVKIIDKKLESLATDVLSRQKKQFDILQKIDEINGLIVDLIT
jgi:hypothetical protein